MPKEQKAHVSGTSTVSMYDDLGADYDRFMDWESRLAAELPFLERQLQAIGAQRVLDAACGTGVHALALAKRGYDVIGADLSVEMIERARDNALRAGLDAQFAVAGFGELASTLNLISPERGNRFDALLCLGNSLPHVLTRKALAITLDDFASCLRPGGLLLIQNRNFDAVLAERQRWMSPQAHQEGEREWLFVRLYDFDADGLVTFNMLRLRRERDRGWSQRVTSTRLWPQTHRELAEALDAAAFETITRFGNLEGDPFDSESSPNLVVTARRSRD